MCRPFLACRKSPAVSFATDRTVSGSDQLRHHISVAAGQTDAGEVEISARNRRFLCCQRSCEPGELVLFDFAVAANNFGVEIRDGVAVEIPAAAGASTKVHHDTFSLASQRAVRSAIAHQSVTTAFSPRSSSVHEECNGLA